MNRPPMQRSGPRTATETASSELAPADRNDTGQGYPRNRCTSGEATLTADNLTAWAQGHEAGYQLGVAVSYEVGYRDALQAVAENVAELETLGPDWREAVAVSPEQRYQERLSSMRTANGIAEHLDQCQERQRQHDARCIERAAKIPPITDWATVRAEVTPSVWRRIQDDRREVSR